MSTIFVSIVALLQTYFLILEMFLWQKPKTLKAFGFTSEFAAQTASLAKNQGLYNGFLAAGLVWGMFQPDPNFSFQIKIFFLTCVLVAGIYGAVTANKKILFVQALPALVAIGCLLI